MDVDGTEKVAERPGCESRTTAMNLVDTTPKRRRLAIASSIALHFCALVLLCLAPWPISSASDATLVVHMIVRAAPGPPARPATIEHRTAPTTAPATTVRGQRAPAAVRVPPLAVHAGTPEHAGTMLHVMTHPVLRPAPSVGGAAVGAGATGLQAAVAAAVPVAASAPVGTAPTAAASPAAVAAAEAVPVAAKTPGGSGGGGGDKSSNPGLFSATYPPAAAQTGALDAIRAALPARTRVRITVDENGRAAIVDWLTPPPDPTLADAIRARLMALPYIPAECDGLPCTGIISLTT